MSNRTRNRAITIRMTDTEYEKFTSAFSSCSSEFNNQTDFVLSLLKKKPIIIIEDFRELLIELKRQGNNLNQLVRYFHLGGYIEQDIVILLNNCNEIYKQLSSLIKALEKTIPEKKHKTGDDNAAA